MQKIDWQKVKACTPNVAVAILSEYRKRNGFIPYEQGYVYVIQACGTGYFKIGKTVNPDKRILQIAPQMPFPTRYVRVWTSDFMSAAERNVHRHLDFYRSNGEWFDFSREGGVAMLDDLLNGTAWRGLIQNAYFEDALRACYESCCDRSENLALNQIVDIETTESYQCVDFKNLFLQIESDLQLPIPEDLQLQIDKAIKLDKRQGK